MTVTGRRRAGCGGRPGSPRTRRRRRWRGCGGWARTPPSPARWRRGTCRRRGPGRCAGGRTCCPPEHRAGADAILLAAAAGGADLAGPGALAEEIRRRTARPDADGDDGFKDRSVRLDVTFGQCGKLTGNLTPQCTAALGAVLDALGKKAGPEDTRTVWQRRHDAVEEMCRRLIAAGGVPDRAGQPAQIQVHMTLDQLRGLTARPGAARRGGRRRGRRPGPARTVTRRSSRSSPATSTTSSSASSPPSCSAASPARPCGPGLRLGPARSGPARLGPARLGPAGGPAAGSAARAAPGIAAGEADRGSGGGCGPSGPPGSSSSPAPSACCPGPAGWPATCGPGCPMTWSRRSACRWTSARSPTPSRSTCAGRSPSGTGTAGSPAAPSPPRHASRTTSSPAPRAARPA